MTAAGQQIPGGACTIPSHCRPLGGVGDPIIRFSDVDDGIAPLVFSEGYKSTGVPGQTERL